MLNLTCLQMQGTVVHHQTDLQSDNSRQCILSYRSYPFDGILVFRYSWDIPGYTYKRTILLITSTVQQKDVHMRTLIHLKINTTHRWCNC